MTDTARRPQRTAGLTLFGSAFLAALVGFTVAAAAPESTLGSTTIKVAACTSNVRTSPTTRARIATHIRAGTRVTVVARVSGSAWRVSCGGHTTSSRYWYRISSIAGRSVASRYGVRYLYVAVGLVRSVPTHSRPAAPPVAPPASAPGSIRKVSSSISVSSFRAIAADPSVGVIQMAGGVYRGGGRGWRNAVISRTKPLVIRAAPGATVTFDAASDGDYGDQAFYLSGASHITFDGCPGRFVFSHYLLAQTGIFLVVGASYITADCITVRNAAANSKSNGMSSHVIYVSRGSHDLVFDAFDVAHLQASDVPGASYGLNGLHVYTGGSGASVYNVTARNWTVANANWAMVIRDHTTGVRISGWRVSDSGHSTGVAMDFGSDNTGTVSNSVTTGSAGRGAILGRITDMGGNAWR